MSREAMQQALEVLENAGEAVYARGGIAAVGSLNIAAQALRKALVDADDTSQKRVDEKAKREHEWVGLTDEEIDYQAKKDDHAVYFALGALWAEAKLKEKNT